MNLLIPYLTFMIYIIANLHVLFKMLPLIDSNGVIGFCGTISKMRFNTSKILDFPPLADSPKTEVGENKNKQITFQRKTYLPY